MCKLLSDPSIAQLLVLTLTQNTDEGLMPTLGYHTPKFFLLKLLYVYTVLETLIPRSKIQQSGIIYESASTILEEHLYRLNSEPPERLHQVLEMIRETQFLLDSCQPAKSNSNSYSSPNNDLGLRSELLITRMKRGIIGILARQKVLGMIVTDRRFAKYARAMVCLNISPSEDNYILMSKPTDLFVCSFLNRIYSPASQAFRLLGN